MTTIHEKLNRANSKKNELTFKIEHNGKTVYESKMDVPEYADNINLERNSDIYYFFKDVAFDFEQAVNKIQKEAYLNGGM